MGHTQKAAADGHFAVIVTSGGGSRSWLAGSAVASPPPGSPAPTPRLPTPWVAERAAPCPRRHPPPARPFPGGRWGRSDTLKQLGGGAPMRLPALRSPVPFQRPVPSPQGQAASETLGPRAPWPGGSERALGASAQPALRSRTPAPAHAGSRSGPRKQPPVWAPSGPAVTNAILWHGTGRPLSAGWAGWGRPAQHRDGAVAGGAGGLVRLPASGPAGLGLLAAQPGSAVGTRAAAGCPRGGAAAPLAVTRARWGEAAS